MTRVATKRADRLEARLTSYDRYQLLLIAALGYIPFEREAPDLLFQIIARRYERASVIALGREARHLAHPLGVAGARGFGLAAEAGYATALATARAFSLRKIVKPC